MTSSHDAAGAAGPTDTGSDAVEDVAEITPLNEPRDGVPSVIDRPDTLARAVESLRNGRGPVAVDAERASGHRYGQRAFLVQLRREGAGTLLIDPDALHDLSSVSHALDGSEWILHAANQDLPCLHEVGMAPSALFDTELAARLLGMPRVGLAAVVANELGLGLAKEYSAANWSTRPLPPEWLRYAALDVEVLIELRDILETKLDEAGKLEAARQEFEHVRLMPPPAPRQEPWRRTSGIHAIRDPRTLAIVRELWNARELMAQHRDTSPGRLMPDSAIVVAAVAAPKSVPDLTALKGFTGRLAHRQARTWLDAIDRGRRLNDDELPLRTVPSDGPPPVKVWKDKRPEAAEALTKARALVTKIAEEENLPVENLLQPDLLRRLCWEPPTAVDIDSVSERLADGGARPWQISLVAGPLVEVLRAAS